VLVHPGADRGQRLLVVDATQLDRAGFADEEGMQLLERQAHGAELIIAPRGSPTAPATAPPPRRTADLSRSMRRRTRDARDSNSRGACRNPAPESAGAARAPRSGSRD